MAYRVVWSRRAVEDLEAIARYSAADSEAYAAAVKTILTTAKNFTRFPFSGRIVPELGDESIRKWFAYSYRVIYRIEGGRHQSPRKNHNNESNWNL